MSIRLYKTATLSKATGVNDIFIFPNVPQGSAWTGSIQVLNAPNNALHQAAVSGVIWAEWIGYQPSPVIQAIGGEVITITSTGLEVGIVYESTLLGKEEDQNIFIPVWPLSSSFQVDPVTLLATVSSVVDTVEQDFNNPPEWMQAVSIQFQDDGNGTAIGLEVFVQALTLGGYTHFHGTVGLNQTLIVPVDGGPFRVVWIPISGTFLGFVNFYGLQNTIQGAKLLSTGPTNTTSNLHSPAQLGAQQGVNVNILAGTTTPVIAAPPVGYQVRVRSISLHFAAAPVAGTGYTLRCHNGGSLLHRKDYDASIPQTGFPENVDIWVPDELIPSSIGLNQVNIPDSLDVTNGAAVAMVFTAAYEIWPTPLEAI